MTEVGRHCDGKKSIGFRIMKSCVSTTQQMTCSAPESGDENLCPPSPSCRVDWLTSQRGKVFQDSVVLAGEGWLLGQSLCQAQKKVAGTSLMAQWLRIRLPMQGTRVRALFGEDPTCRGATKPVCHNY